MSELIVVGEDTPAQQAPMNQKQLEALVFHLAIDEDLDGNAIFYRLRREYGQTDLKKNNIEKVGDQLRAAWKDAPPAVRARMRLEAAEMALQGDLLLALGKLELTNPRDVRDCVNHIQAVAGGAMEHQLKAAVEYLEVAESAEYGALRERFLALYPEDDDD